MGADYFTATLPKTWTLVLMIHECFYAGIMHAIYIYVFGYMCIVFIMQDVVVAGR